jgi:recombination protein RecA
MAVAHDVQALLEQLSRKHGELSRPLGPPLPLPEWPELEAILPDHGFPRGVVELTSPGALGGATSVALAAIKAGQSRGEHAWCAWIDPEGSLHAPGVVAAGVDLARLLVVRPHHTQLGRMAVKAVGSGAFEVVVVDVDAPVSLRGTPPPGAQNRGGGSGRRLDLLVRKLALAAEPSGATVLLLSDAERPRPVPWPVALRLELSRPEPESLSVRVVKERRGRADSLAKTIPFLPVARLGTVS